MLDKKEGITTDKGFDLLRVSNLIIDTAKRNSTELTNLKLQKIHNIEIRNP